MKSSEIRGERVKVQASAYAIVYRVQKVFDIHDDITLSKGVFVRLTKNRKNVYSPSYIKPRMIAMAYVYKYTKLTYQEIAGIFTVKFSTVIHAEKWCKQMLENNDKEFAGPIRQIEEECDKLYIMFPNKIRKERKQRKKSVRNENKEKKTGTAAGNTTAKSRTSSAGLNV